MKTDRPPSPKSVRLHYGKVDRCIWKLRMAMNAAHNANVIIYDKYPDESPCAALDEVRERVKKTTEKQLAEAMRQEIRGY